MSHDVRLDTASALDGLPCGVGLLGKPDLLIPPRVSAARMSRGVARRASEGGARRAMGGEPHLARRATFPWQGKDDSAMVSGDGSDGLVPVGEATAPTRHHPSAAACR